MGWERTGDWFAGGCLVALICLEQFHWHPGWVIGIGLFGGWPLNEKRRDQADKRAAARDAWMAAHRGERHPDDW